MYRWKKVTEQDDTTTEEENPSGAPQRHKMQSITALKKVLTEAKIKKQQWRYYEVTKGRLSATEAGLGDNQCGHHSYNNSDDNATASSSTHVVAAEVYAKMTQSRGERSTARSERREGKEKEAMIQKQKEEENHLAKEKEAEEQRKGVEHALLEEEGKSQEEVL